MSLLKIDGQVLAHWDKVRVGVLVLYWTFLNVLEHHIQHSFLKWDNIVWFDIIHVFYICNVM